MARTDKTAPARLFWDDGCWHPMRLVWRIHGLKDLRRYYNRRDRYVARRALHRGDEPAPVQPRGRARWDLY